jgi:hypothetical protein
LLNVKNCNFLNAIKEWNRIGTARYLSCRKTGYIWKIMPSWNPLTYISCCRSPQAAENSDSGQRPSQNEEARRTSSTSSGSSSHATQQQDAQQSNESGAAVQQGDSFSRPSGAVMRNLDNWRNEQQYESEADELVLCIRERQSVNLTDLNLEVRKKCAAKLLAQDPPAFIRIAYDLNIDDVADEIKAEWLLRAAEHPAALEMIVDEIDAFALQSETVLRQVGEKIADAHPEKIVDYIVNAAKAWHSESPLWHTSSEQSVPKRMAWCLLAAAHRTRLKPLIHDTREPEITLNKSLYEIFQRWDALQSSQFDAPIHPWFRDKLETISPDDLDGQGWLMGTAMAFIGLELGGEAWHEIEHHLQHALEVHAPLVRYAITQQLIRCTADPETASAFAEVSKKFRSYTKLLCSAFFLLSATKDAADPFWKTLTDFSDGAQSRSAFKSSKNQRRMLISLSCLDRYDSDYHPLTVEEKSRLLRICIPLDATADAPAKFIGALQSLAIMLRICGSSSKLGEDTYRRIQACQNADDIQQALDATTLAAFPIGAAGGEQAALGRTRKFESDAGYPNILLHYKSRLLATRAVPDEDDPTEGINQTLSRLDQLVGALASEDDDAWDLLLTEVLKTAHTHALSEINPTAVQQWGQPRAIPLFEDEMPPISDDELRKTVLLALDEHKEENPDLYQVVEHAGNDIKTISTLIQGLKTKIDDSAEGEKTKAIVEFLHFWSIINDKRGSKPLERLNHLTRCISNLPWDELRSALQCILERLEGDQLRERFKGFTVEDTGTRIDRMRVNNDCRNCLAADNVRHEVVAFLDDQLDLAKRFLVIKSPDGRIWGHRSWRALIDLHEEEKNGSREIVYVIDRWFVGDIPERFDQRLIALAMEKAAADGVKLLAIPQACVPSMSSYPGRLQSLGSPSPWAYDGIRLVRNGIYTLEHTSLIA